MYLMTNTTTTISCAYYCCSYFYFLLFILINPAHLSQLAHSIGPLQDHDRLVDCKYSHPNGSRYDLTNLIDPSSWPLNLTTSKSTPPSTTIESISLSLCKKLPFDDHSRDTSCPDGTLVCMYIYNQIGSDRRLEQIIPIAINTLPISVSVLKTAQQESLQLTIHGSIYNNAQQSAVLNLVCSDRKTGNPTTVYDPIQGTLKLDWLTPVACATSNQHDPTDSRPSSPLKRFLSFLFVTFSIYLLLGIWYNYYTYGLTGVDALPHQVFWRELPMNLINFFRSTGRQISTRGSQRSGYTPI